MKSAPIPVHNNFRPCLRICRDIETERIKGGAPGNMLGKGLLKERLMAGYCGVILFAFDESQKLQRKDFSGYRLPATLCLRVNRSPRQVTVFSGFPDFWCGNLRPDFRRRHIIFGANSSDRRQENNSFALIYMYRSIRIDQGPRRARKKMHVRGARGECETEAVPFSEVRFEIAVNLRT